MVPCCPGSLPKGDSSRNYEGGKKKKEERKKRKRKLIINHNLHSSLSIIKPYIQHPSS